MHYRNEYERAGETAEMEVRSDCGQRDIAPVMRNEGEHGSGTNALADGAACRLVGEAVAVQEHEFGRATAAVAGVEAKTGDDQDPLLRIRNSHSQSCSAKAPVLQSMQTLVSQAECEVGVGLGLGAGSGRSQDHWSSSATDVNPSKHNSSLQTLQPAVQQPSTRQEMQERDLVGADRGLIVLSRKHPLASEQPPSTSEETLLLDSDIKHDTPTDNAEQLRRHLPAMPVTANSANEPLGPVTPEEDPVNFVAPCETFYGFIKDAHDALLVIEGVVRGILKPFNGRTGGSGSAAGEAGLSGVNSASDMQIRSGTVIVFAESSSQMKRWRDGERWSPSRAHGPFLLYREVESIRKDSASKGDDSNMEIVPGLDPSFSTKTLKSNTRLVQNGLTKRTITLIGSDGERHRVISYYNRDHVLHLYKDVIGEGYDKIIAERFGSTSIPTADASTTPANPAPPRIMLKTPSMSPTLTALAIDGTVNFKALLAQSISSDNFGRPKQPTPFGNANARAASSRSSISVANIEVEGGKRRRAGTKVKTYAEEDDDFEDEEEYRVAVRPRGAEKQQQQQQQQQKQQQIQLHDQQQLRQSMQGYGMHPGQGGYFDGQQFHMQQHGRPPMSPFEFSPHQQHGGGYGSLRQTYPSQHFAARQDSFPDQQNLQQHHQPQLPPFFSQREAESRWHQGHTSLAVSSRPGSMTQPRSNPSHIHTSHQQQEQQQYQQNQQAFSQPMSASGNFSLPSRHFSQNGPSQPQTLMTHTRSVYLQSITPSSSLLRAPSTLPHQPPLRYEPIHQHDLATLRQSDRVPSAFIRRDDCQPTTGWKNSPGMGAPQFSYHGQHVHPVLEQRRPFTPPTPQHITPPGYSTLQQHQQ